MKYPFFALAIATILQIIGVATNSWTSTEDDTISPTEIATITTGLWKVCVRTLEESKCVTMGITGLAGWFHAVRAFSITGTLVGTAAAIFTGLCVFVFKTSSKKRFYRISMILALAAGTCIVLSIIIYVAKLPGTTVFGFSFGLSTGAGLLSLIAGVILAVEAFPTQYVTLP